MGWGTGGKLFGFVRASFGLVLLCGCFRGEIWVPFLEIGYQEGEVVVVVVVVVVVMMNA